MRKSTRNFWIVIFVTGSFCWTHAGICPVLKHTRSLLPFSPQDIEFIRDFCTDWLSQKKMFTYLQQYPLHLIPIFSVICQFLPLRLSAQDITRKINLENWIRFDAFRCCFVVGYRFPFPLHGCADPNPPHFFDISGVPGDISPYRIGPHTQSVSPDRKISRWMNMEINGDYLIEEWLIAD